jgi:hypothetical protein
MRRIAVLLAVLMVWCSAGLAKPALPVQSDRIAEIEFGLFCAISVTGQSAAAGTASGWIHLVEDVPAFHWPGQRRVPAVLGLAFGVRARTTAGLALPDAEMRVFRPDRPAPDVWSSGISDASPSLAFFRFDTEQELVPGLWSFEAWSGETRLYRVEFDVVPARAGDPIAQACGGTS